ncbi:MAG: VWA domain-containing protein [Kiritimatiellia bacterium]
MNFGAPHLLHTLWILGPLLALLMILAARRRRRQMAALAEPATWNVISTRWRPGLAAWRNVLWLAALLLFLFGLARPQWGFGWEDLKRRGLDIMVALDTSKSMLATDIKPDRLQRSKLGIRDLLAKLKGDRVGLVAFAGSSFLQCPLTIDYAAFNMCLEDVYAGIIPKGGTDVAGALREALRSFKDAREADRVILLLTDGENHEEPTEDIVAELKKKGVRVFCIGVGSPDGELIPVRDERGVESYLKDGEGNVVKSRLNESLLESVALGTGGVYVRAVQSDFGVERLYDEVITKLKRDESGTRRVKRPHERFVWFLAAGFLLLVAEGMMPRSVNGGRKP